MSRSFIHDTFLLVFLKSSRLVIGSTKEFIHGSALSHDGHTHDNRYYTETEVNNLLSGKSDTSHTHNYLNIMQSNEMNLAYGLTGNRDVWFNYRGATGTITDYIFGNGKGGQIVKLSELINLKTKIAALEGSVDMAKLVHSECAEESSRYGKLVCTYIASFVRVKRAGFDSSANGTSCGTGYIDVYIGCSGIIHTISSPIRVNYTSNGEVTLTTLYNNALDDVYLTLEFYNY